MKAENIFRFFCFCALLIAQNSFAEIYHDRDEFVTALQGDTQTISFEGYSTGDDLNWQVLDSRVLFSSRSSLEYSSKNNNISPSGKYDDFQMFFTNGGLLAIGFDIEVSSSPYDSINFSFFDKNGNSIATENNYTLNVGENFIGFITENNDDLINFFALNDNSTQTLRYNDFTYRASTVPLPSGAFLIGTGFIGIMAIRKRN